MRNHRMWARCATHSCQITLPVVRSEDHWCGCNIIVHWCRGRHPITGAGAACTARADVVCTAGAGVLHAATGAGVVVVDTYTGAGTAYTAGAGAVYWAATYSGTCTAASSPPRCATGQRHLERELLVAPHGAQSALSSPLCGARAAFDLHWSTARVELQGNTGATLEQKQPLEASQNLLMLRHVQKDDAPDEDHQMMQRP